MNLDMEGERAMSRAHQKWGGGGGSAREGPLAGGPQCRMSNLRNGYVNCHNFSNVHVDFKMLPCRMSNLRNCLCHVDNIFSRVDRLHVAC